MTSFLIPAVSIAALTTVLALIILLAERYLMDYGEVSLRVNDKEFKVRGGNSVLSTLKDQKIFVPSACGGRATCAYCKVKAVGGFGEVLPTETPLLTKEEIAENIRLACQIKVRNDCAIEIPSELFSIREFKAVFSAYEDLTYDIRLFRFALVNPETIDYRPGQYVQFQSPQYGSVSESVYRAYSMCGFCSDKSHIELMVRLVPEGICTTYLFSFLKVGDPVTFTGPFGDFFLHESDHRMICVAGGSGMAPIRAILLAMTTEEIARRRPIFFFGARSKRDLFMVEEWRAFERAHPDFRFIPALSNPEPEDNWDGETGRVTGVIPRHIPDGGDCEGYLCGSPGFLNACVEVLVSLGVPEERIYYDKFG